MKKILFARFFYLNTIFKFHTALRLTPNRQYANKKGCNFVFHFISYNFDWFCLLRHSTIFFFFQGTICHQWNINSCHHLWRNIDIFCPCHVCSCNFSWSWHPTKRYRHSLKHLVTLQSLHTLTKKECWNSQEFMRILKHSLHYCKIFWAIWKNVNLPNKDFYESGGFLGKQTMFLCAKLEFLSC